MRSSFFLLVVSLFSFSFQICTLFFFPNLFDQRSGTCNISFFSSDIYRYYPSSHSLHTRKRDMRELKEGGPFLEPFRSIFWQDCVQFFCRGVLGMGQFWRTKQCLRLWAGLSLCLGNTCCPHEGTDSPV